jgi:hypothetical protein
MKKVSTISLGSSKQDFEFETRFLGHSFQVRRLGADDDMGKAWELMRRQQTSADAIGLGEVGDHYLVGQDTRINKVTQRLLNVVTRVPATTGATLRRLLQVRAVRYVQNHLGHYFNNNLVLFLSGMRNYDMAVAMSDYTPNLKFADALAQTGTPTGCWARCSQLELYAKGSDWALSGRPGEMLQAVAQRLQEQAHRGRGGQVARHRRHLPRTEGGRQRQQPGRQDRHHLGGRRAAAGLLQAIAGSTSSSTSRRNSSSAWSAPTSSRP